MQAPILQGPKTLGKPVNIKKTVASKHKQIILAAVDAKQMPAIIHMFEKVRFLSHGRLDGLRQFTCLFVAMFFGTQALAQDPPEEPAVTSSTEAEPEAESSEEEESGKIDKGNFLVLPIFITEPAIGEGLGLGLVYFHKKKDPNTPQISTASSISQTNQQQNPPPTASGVFGAYTNNDTKAFGIGHAGTYFQDKVRTVGVLATAEINSTVFFLDIPFGFGLDGELAYANFKRRLGTSNMFLGMSLTYMDALINFDLGLGGNDPGSFGLLDFDFQNVGIGASAIYDSRDDTMMPGDGALVDFTMSTFDKALGGDFNYVSFDFKALSFHELHERFVLGLRLDVSTVDGKPPFFARPFVSIRGIPALRYQGDTAGVVEVEGRFNISPRWAAVAFGGAGFAHSGDTNLETADTIKAYGAGIRFQALKSQNVWLGFDIAKGPEEYAWYIQMGHPW